MPDSKIHARKQGTVFTVFIDSGSNQAVPLSGPEDSPPGCMHQTLVSEGALKAAFPGREFVYHEKEAPPPRVITRTKEIHQEAAAMLTGKIPLQTVATNRIPSQQAYRSAACNKAREILKRLEVARNFASAKNKRILDIQIEATISLINEVFPEAFSEEE